MDKLRLIERLARGVVRRRKRLALLTFLAAAVLLVPAAYIGSTEPPRYRASAVILLEVRPDGVPLFEEFSPFRPLPVQLAILRSRSLAENVIESLPKDALRDLVENPYYVDFTQGLRNAFRRLMGGEPEVTSPHLRVLRELQDARVQFVPSNQHGIVEIHAEASKPHVAVDIVNIYIEVLLSRTSSFNIEDARVSREFLESQLAEIKRTVQASEEALRSFTASHGGVRIPERSQAAVTQLAESENSLAELVANKRMVDVRLKGLREKLESQRQAGQSAQPAQMAAAPAPPAPEIQRLRNQLSQLETALLDLRTKYTDQHPRVVLVEDRIAEVRRQLGDVVKETTPVTPAPGAVRPSERVNFAEQVVALETAQHTLAAQEDALRRQADALRQSLSGLSRGEVEYSRLARELESNRNLYSLVSEKLSAARIREQGEMKIVKVIDPAGAPRAMASQRRMTGLGLALAVALTLGVGLPAGLEWIYRRVETEDDVQATTGLPVFALIPHLGPGRPSFTSSIEAGRSHRPSDTFIFTEAFRNLRVALELMGRPEALRTILVASPFPGEGKSTITVNLGRAFAEAGRRVLLADTDFLRPTLHRTLKVKQTGGLVEALRATRPIEQYVTQVGEGMWLVPCGGAIQPHSRSILASGRLKEFVSEMADTVDVVLCDSSPILLVPDNLFLASAVDGVLLVAKAGNTSCRDLAQAKTALERAGARVLGVVINEMPISVLRGSYKRYYDAYVPKGTE